jgi:hypothetical protein
MSRFIVFLGVLQTMLVFLGFEALAIVMKTDGYPGEPAFIGGLVVIRWSLRALWLRRYGMVLLLIPLAWTVITACSQGRRNWLLPVEGWLAVGIGISLVIAVMFIYTCIYPCIALPT